jgi:N4-(beta-N-acetylglucosaminyl)-L-asparaginase
MQRRKFLALSALTTSAISLASKVSAQSNSKLVDAPLVLSTWEPNKKANATAWDVLVQNGKALDAIENGIKITEADPNDQSVGYGGRPDRDGFVTLDSCIMDHLGNCGSVMAMENIMHAISVARLVMEKTPHVQIVGIGAQKFALENGFEKVNLLTEKSENEWKEWLKSSHYNLEYKKDNSLPPMLNHDTIGMVALDKTGNLAGGCSSSGMAYKMRGRVGDSPIIGAGLYVDGEIGAVACTGQGEEVVRTVGSHTVVEMMRHGYSPELACKEAIRRLVKLRGKNMSPDWQVGYIALNKKGQYGCYALTRGFTMAVRSKSGEKIIEAKSWLK